MRLVTFISLLFSLGFSLSGSAEVACPDVRLDQTSLKNVPVMDQDGAALCWSYSASVLIDAWRFSHGDRNSTDVTSPVGLGILSEDQDNGKQGGTIFHGVSFAKKKGVTCSHAELSKKYRSSDFHLREMLPPPSYPQLGCVVSTFLDEILGRETINTVSMAKSLEFAQVRKDVETVCKLNAIPVSIGKVRAAKVNRDPGNKDLSDIPDLAKKLLGKPNPQPIGVSLCPEVLFGHNYKPMQVKDGIPVCAHHFFHEIAIVGSRKDKVGHCQFLIRNSWGASCKPYDWPCERGQTWIDADALASNVGDFTWLED